MAANALFYRLKATAASVYVSCLAIVALTAIVVAAGLAVQSDQSQTRQAVDSVAQLASVSAANTTAGLGGAVKFRKSDDVVAQLETLSKTTAGYMSSALVLNLEGETIGEFGAPRPGSTYANAMEEALTNSATVTLDDGMTIVAPIPFGKDGQIAGFMISSWTAAPALAIIEAAKIRSLAISVGVLVALLFLATLILRRVLGRPLIQLEQAIHAVANGNYDDEIPRAGWKSEFGRIASLIDEMRIGLAEARASTNQRIQEQERERVVMDNVSAALNELAQGNLCSRISEPFPENFEKLRADYNATTRTLQEALGTVVKTAIDIRKETDGIHEHSLALAKRTENQAATLEQTAAALSELTESIRVVADDAKEVETIVGVARGEADKGGMVVQQAVSAMSEIESSSEQISTIISVIDDIAFQTNLLALNAGVEAARAGDAGRGFAVVASEVRALAQRSSQAAQEIKELISGSSDQVARGVDLVGRTGEALNDISERVKETAELMSKMAGGAAQQSSSLGEINIGMGQLDQATQRNAGMVEQAGVAHQSLRAQSHRLGELVDRFTLSPSGPIPADDAPKIAAQHAQTASA